MQNFKNIYFYLVYVSLVCMPVYTSSAAIVVTRTRESGKSTQNLIPKIIIGAVGVVSVGIICRYIYKQVQKKNTPAVNKNPFTVSPTPPPVSPLFGADDDEPKPPLSLGLGGHAQQPLRIHTASPGVNSPRSPDLSPLLSLSPSPADSPTDSHFPPTSPRLRASSAPNTSSLSSGSSLPIIFSTRNSAADQGQQLVAPTDSSSGEAAPEYIDMGNGGSVPTDADMLHIKTVGVLNSEEGRYTIVLGNGSICYVKMHPSCLGHGPCLNITTRERNWDFCDAQGKLYSLTKSKDRFSGTVCYTKDGKAFDIQTWESFVREGSTPVFIWEAEFEEAPVAPLGVPMPSGMPATHDSSSSSSAVSITAIIGASGLRVIDGGSQPTSPDMQPIKEVFLEGFRSVGMYAFRVANSVTRTEYIHCIKMNRASLRDRPSLNVRTGERNWDFCDSEGNVYALIKNESGVSGMVCLWQNDAFNRYSWKNAADLINPPLLSENLQIYVEERVSGLSAPEGSTVFAASPALSAHPLAGSVSLDPSRIPVVVQSSKFPGMLPIKAEFLMIWGDDKRILKINEFGVPDRLIQIQIPGERPSLDPITGNRNFRYYTLGTGVGRMFGTDIDSAMVGHPLGFEYLADLVDSTAVVTSPPPAVPPSPSIALPPATSSSSSSSSSETEIRHDAASSAWSSPTQLAVFPLPITYTTGTSAEASENIGVVFLNILDHRPYGTYFKKGVPFEENAKTLVDRQRDGQRAIEVLANMGMQVFCFQENPLDYAGDLANLRHRPAEGCFMCRDLVTQFNPKKFDLLEDHFLDFAENDGALIVVLRIKNTNNVLVVINTHFAGGGKADYASKRKKRAVRIADAVKGYRKAFFADKEENKLLKLQFVLGGDFNTNGVDKDLFSSVFGSSTSSSAPSVNDSLLDGGLFRNVYKGQEKYTALVAGVLQDIDHAFVTAGLELTTPLGLFNGKTLEADPQKLRETLLSHGHIAGQDKKKDTSFSDHAGLVVTVKFS